MTPHMKNQAYGYWSQEETNWSEKDMALIADVMKETPRPTSYEELLAQHESKFMK